MRLETLLLAVKTRQFVYGIFDLPVFLH
jgi:hypothetical protein